MPKDEATARPWSWRKTRSGARWVIEGPNAPNGDDTWYIAELETGRAEDAANARLIVRSVNNAERLAETLRVALRTLNAKGGPLARERDDASAVARAALAAWEEE